MKAIKEKILFVEDDRFDRMAFERYAKEECLPFEYILAGSVSEANGILKEQKVNAVVTDYMLGDGTAFDLFEEIGSIPVIIITGAGDQEIAVKAMKEGAYDYLIKDTEGNYLRALPVTLKNAIGIKRAEEELKKYRERLEELVDSRTAELRKEIEDRKKTEELLRYSVNILEALLNVTTESIILFEKNGIIHAINETAAGRLGNPKEEFNGKCFYDYLPVDIANSRKRHVDEVIQTGMPLRFEDERENYLFDINLYPILNNNSEVESIAFFARDLSPILKLQKEIISISENERQRIGLDLHDDLGQHLTAIKYMVTNTKQKIFYNEKVKSEDLDEISSNISHAVDRVRGMAKGLYPITIEKNGFLIALEEMCNEVEKIFKVSCIIETDGNITIKDNIKAMHLFYIAKESINNAIKHAKSKKILLFLSARDSIFHMIIENNFGPSGHQRSTRGIGIDIMKYRSNAIGGTLRIKEKSDKFIIEFKSKI